MRDDVIQRCKLRFLHGNTVDIVMLLCLFQCDAPFRTESFQLCPDRFGAGTGPVDQRLAYGPANVIDICAHLGEISVVFASVRQKGSSFRFAFFDFTGQISKILKI